MSEPAVIKEADDHASTVAKHYNQLEEAGLEKRSQSRIFYLRNLNNWIKSVLIGEIIHRINDEKGGGGHHGLTVLDLCCGKGGDLLKWKKGNIGRLVCADIAGTSVEQCESRYNDMQDRCRHDRGPPQKMFSAEFITADCTKDRLKDLYKDRDIKFDLVSCQFSFHYCFESFPQAKMMLQNACECLDLGGYFIGTTPDAYEIVRRLRESPDLTFGNDVYSVSYCSEDKTNIPMFGAKYDFHLEGVVDCPEFLVYFPLLEKMAEDHGMKLIYRKPFDQYFSEKVNVSEHRSLLGKMQALECYPPADGTELVSSKEEDYVKSKTTLQKLAEEDDRPEELKQRKPTRIGTLSQAEWDATTIYLVFAFQKVCDMNTGEKWTGANETQEGSSSQKRTSDQVHSTSADAPPHKQMKS